MGTQQVHRRGPPAGLAELRAHLHRAWSGVAEAWGTHADFIDARAAGLTERLLALAAPRPGERVLELACGPGGAGLAAAPLVAPGGEVVLSDVSEAMVAIAARRAAARGLANVSGRALDLEDILEPDASYDVALCREGLMLVPDPGRAAREIARVLRPGGRVALSVWGPRARNPWLGAILDAVAEQVGAPVPPPGVPHPFALEDADRLAGLLSQAGLEDVTLEELPVPNRVPSLDEWWARTASLAGGLMQRLGALPEQALEAVRGRASATIAAYQTPDGLEIPGVVLIASARRG